MPESKTADVTMVKGSRSDEPARGARLTVDGKVYELGSMDFEVVPEPTDLRRGLVAARGANLVWHATIRLEKRPRMRAR